MQEAPPLKGDAPYRGTSPDLLPMESAVRDPAGEGTDIDAGPARRRRRPRRARTRTRR